MKRTIPYVHQGSSSSINFKHKKPRKKPSHSTNETIDMGTPFEFASQFAQSFTQVSKTKSEIDAGGQHNKLRHVTWHMSLPGKKYPKHKGIVNKIGHSQDGIITCDAGVQKVTTLANFMLRNQIQATWSAAQGYTDVNSLPISFFDINVDERSAGNIISNAATVRTYDKVYVEKINGSLSFTNLSTVPMELWVYAYCTKTPNADGPASRWQNLNTATFAMAQQPAPVVQATNAAAPGGAPTKGYPTLEMIGYRPSALPTFKKAYKTIGKLHVTLSPGETTDLEYVIDVAKYFDKRFIAQLPTEICPYKTVSFMIIQQGTPVRTTVAGISNRMHHSANELGYINNHYYHVVPVLGENKTPMHVVDGNEVKTAFESVNVSDKFVNDMDTVAIPTFV